MQSEFSNSHIPADLSANRQGRLSANQLEKLKLSAGSALGSAARLFALSSIPGICLGGMLLLALLRAPLPIIGVFALFTIAIGLVVVLMNVVRSSQARNRLLDDLALGIVEQGEGRLIYGEVGYVVKSDIEDQNQEQRFKLSSLTSGLVPGVRYRFYYLPHSHLVVSAESLEDQNEEQIRQGLLEALAEAHNFSISALEENRQGKLASQQIPQLLPNLAWGIGLLLLPPAITIYWMNILGAAERVSTGWTMIIWLVVGAVALYGAWLIYRASADLIEGRVVELKGIGKKVSEIRGSRRFDEVSGSTSVTHYYEIGDQRFRVPAKAYAALISQQPYRLYYAPRTKVMLSIEPIDVTASSNYRVQNPQTTPSI
jgi:hypothetical protein